MAGSVGNVDNTVVGRSVELTLSFVQPLPADVCGTWLLEHGSEHEHRRERCEHAQRRESLKRKACAPKLGVGFADHEWRPAASPGSVAVDEAGHFPKLN